MENKRLMITIVGIMFLSSALFGLISLIFKSDYNGYFIIYQYISRFILLIIAIDILRSKEWARRGIIYYFIFNTLIEISINLDVLKKAMGIQGKYANSKMAFFENAVLIACAAIFIHFFTRPKVKEQFKSDEF